MITLGIDTSNYATSLAIFDTNTGLLADTKQFLPVKEGALGLRQADAVFYHTRQLPLSLARLPAHVLQQVETVAVSDRPRGEQGSYMPCFLVGVGAARAFAASRGLPVRLFTHQQGHMMAALYGSGQMALADGRFFLLHISGGTTDLLLVNGGEITPTGGTSDLYAGQAVDRLAVRLGFAFPGGEALSALAEECTQAVVPRPSVKGTFCSLSGLENQCAALLEKGEAPAYAARFCLTTIAAALVGIVKAARALYGQLPLVAAGGVMSSSVIRPYMEKALDAIYFAPPKYSSDNAIGLAILGQEGLPWQM